MFQGLIKCYAIGSYRHIFQLNQCRAQETEIKVKLQTEVMEVEMALAGHRFGKAYDGREGTEKLGVSTETCS